MSSRAAKLTELILYCRSCGQRLNNHQFGLLASVIAGPQEIPQLAEFFRLSKQHQLEDLAKFQEWDGERDVVQAFVIRCPNGAAELVLLKDVFDPWAANELYGQETLAPKDASVAFSLVPPEKWQTF